MSIARCGVLVLLLGLLVHAVPPTDWNQSINMPFISGAGFRSNFTQNFAGNATLSVYHHAGFYLCLQRYAPAPALAAFSNRSCTFLMEVQQQTKNVSDWTAIILPDLRAITYYIGMSPLTDNIIDFNFTVNISSKVCPNDTVWNGVDCQEPNSIKGNYQLQPNASLLIAVPVVPFTGKLSLSLDTSVINAKVVLSARFMASPYLNYDVKAYNTMIETELPRIGKWYLLIESADSRPFTLNVTDNSIVCNSTRLGPNCNITINTQPQLNFTLSSGSYMYFKYVANATYPLFAVIRSVDNNTNPQILVSRDQLPVMTSDPQDLAADIIGCNQIDCLATVRVRTPMNTIPENSTVIYYVGVYVSPSANSTIFGIWFNSTCPTRCPIRGNCTESGPTTGECTCSATTYSGLDCWIVTDSFEWYDWILIGIAAGVGFLVLFGILLFVCLRGNRPEFDKGPYQSIQ